MKEMKERSREVSAISGKKQKAWAYLEDKKLPLIDHLRELRARLIVCLISVTAMSMISFFYWPSIMELLSPVGMEMVYISPEEALFTRIRISFISGFIFSIPILMFEVWKFIKPALSFREKKLTVVLGLFSCVMFYLSIFFNLAYAIPPIIKFLLRFSFSEELRPLISISKYTSFLINMTVAFSLISQIPILMILMVVSGFATYHSLARIRGRIILINFIIAAIITPPDAFSQFILAVPMCALFELGLIMTRLVRA